MGYIDPDDKDVIPVLVDAVDVEFAGKYSTRFALDTIKRLEQNAQNSVRSYNE